MAGVLVTFENHVWEKAGKHKANVTIKNFMFLTPFSTAYSTYKFTKGALNESGCGARSRCSAENAV